MSKWHDNIDWFVVMVGVIFLFIFLSEVVGRQQKGDLIKRCISEGKTAVIENSELKECKEK